MSDPSDLREFEHEVDTLNVVFGAALGAYIGILMSTEKLSDSDLWLMVLLLALTANFLLIVRAVGRASFKQEYVGCRFPGNIAFAAATALVIELLALGLPAGNKFNIIFRGWALTLAIGLGTSWLRAKLAKHD